MALFSRREAGARLPADVVTRMDLFGQYEFDSTRLAPGIDVWSQLQSPLLEFAQADPAGFVEALVAAVRPGGGWALYGASRTIGNLIAYDYEHPRYAEVRMAALEFLRANGVPPKFLTGGDWDFWLRSRTGDEPWLTGAPLPPADSTRIIPLGAGELRRLAQVTSEEDSNVVYVRCEPDGTHVAVVEGRKSDEDESRVHWDWLRADSAYALYAHIGDAFQTPTYWVAPELAPFIPLPRPKIQHSVF
ncbi:hypothetical protein KDL01_41080 [Actinospica durhamensis]|uniref:Uncharacterized protein n=1 Tax=Actinospica durhamensis TaxID=1508375 RepID=A0A941EYN2_9ACTN|nr:hypothetical protein [Actinospica durhamensis]MBR7839716.1 hypothetical protein [Actinospica durhamensis]